MRVYVMGVGFCGSYPTSSGYSYRELIRRAATMAYRDAGLAPEQVDAAISVEEDFISGYSIADEYVPDQLGMVRKPVYTVPGDFLHGICSGVMQLRTGRFKTVVVEAYSKASNILTKDELLHFAYDPVFNRLGVTPHWLAGIEMQSFCDLYGLDEEKVAEIVVKEREAALTNPLAPYAEKLTVADVIGARPVAEPLTELMVAPYADAAVVAVLGVEEVAESSDYPVLVAGTGWNSANSILERRDHANSDATEAAARMALEEAEMELGDVDVFYLSDQYAHRLLMHQVAVGLPPEPLPFVNPDGGAMGTGDLFEATSGPRFFDAVRMLRDEAGAHQIDEAEVALVHGWRGLPTDSCAVVVLEA
ncbi:MAG: hypothetical protein D6806_05465 [Deltaproteobacteria bacterium]|nr:MAG: hypothetical protein D6806_05465 [Deltaproteobacteria bacterium]